MCLETSDSIICFGVHAGHFVMSSINGHSCSTICAKDNINHRRKHISLSASVSLCVYVSLCVCLPVWTMDVYLYLFLCDYLCGYAFACLCVCMSVSASVCLYACLCVCVYLPVCLLLCLSLSCMQAIRCQVYVEANCCPASF